MNEAFGSYIRQRREALGLSLRAVAMKIGMAPAYLSDVERGNRYAPPDKFLSALEQVLEISGDDKDEFYDLAGKCRNDGYPDLREYIDSTDIARVALRKARDYKISDRQWQDFIDSMVKNDASSN